MQRGFSLIEIHVAIVLFLVGVLALATANTVGVSTMNVNRENARAMYAAQRVMESIETRDVPFEALFAAFHPDPLAVLPAPVDLLDPLAATGDPVVLSRHFDVTGLKPLPDDPDGRVGEVVFPTADGPGGPELREDVAGRDLDGDLAIDADDHAGDYVLLPVTVRVEWMGRNGPRRVEIPTLLVRR